MAVTENRTATNERSETATDQVREFSTRWQREDLTMWRSWSRKDLTGVVVAGGRGLPVVGMFDFFTGRTVGLLGSVELYRHETLRIFAENPAPVASHFVRYADFDAVYAQYSGCSTIESECGQIRLQPFEIGLVPAGIAHRTTGDSVSRRLAIFSYEPVQAGVSPEEYTSERAFEVGAEGGISWEGPPSALARADRGYDMEACISWHGDWRRPLWYRRPLGALTGGTTEGYGPIAFRLFDFFKGRTGQHRGDPNPLLFHNSEMGVRVYNTEGYQFGFHRGNGQEEVWMQFRGTSRNATEYGEIELSAGQTTAIPSGISHNIFGGPGFLRMNVYSKRPFELAVDPLQQVTSTRFEVVEK